MAPPRILLCGDVLGRLNQLFKRVSHVNESAGPFDCILCVGQFFPESPDLLEEFLDYVEMRSSIPLPTYFIGDYGIASLKVLSAASKNFENKGFKADGLDICENLYWLRGSGKFNLHGLSVAYLSGRSLSDSQQFGKYCQDDVDVLRALAEEPGIVDLFLTNEWPVGIINKTLTSNIPSEATYFLGCDSLISELVAEIKPRYHIAGSKGIFYAREPYSNVDAAHVTRFIGLSSVGNKDKQKFIHAISPTPASSMTASELCAKPPNTTSSPYTVVEQSDDATKASKRTNDNNIVSDSQYWRYDISQKRQKLEDNNRKNFCFKFVSSGSCPRGENCNYSHDNDAREQSMKGVCFEFLNKGKCEKGLDCKFKHSLQDNDTSVGSENCNVNRAKGCWFCLSGSNVETHLIVTIGESFYCTLAKGPLVQEHVLILPIEHLPNSLSLPNECDEELCRVQNSLKMFFRSHGNEVVFFELASKRGTHGNIQVVPIPSSKSSAAGNIFNLAAEKLGFKFASMKGSSNGDIINTDRRRTLKNIFDGSFGLFYAELPDGTLLSHCIEENDKFPVQFGRQVMAGLFKKADRGDWRNCNMKKEEEIQMVESFKNGFREFDPNQ